MSVPETPMNENHLPAAAENQIGAPGQIASVQTIAIALSVKHLADAHLDAGVFAFDRLHGSPSYRWRLHRPLRPSYGRERGFLHYCSATPHARLAHRVSSLVFNLEIDVVDLFRPAAKAFVKGFQEMNVIETLGDRVGIVARTRDCGRKAVNARGRQSVVSDGRHSSLPPLSPIILRPSRFACATLRSGPCLFGRPTYPNRGYGQHGPQPVKMHQSQKSVNVPRVLRRWRRAASNRADRISAG